MHTHDADVIVVGAGAAGLAAAQALSGHGRRVIVLEAGRTFDRRLLSPDLFQADDVIDAWWPPIVHEAGSTSTPSTYRQGRGVGGGAAINGMVGVPGDTSTYDWNPYLVPTMQALLRRTTQVAPGKLSRIVAGPIAAAFGESADVGSGESFDRSGWASAALWMDTEPLRRRQPYAESNSGNLTLMTEVEVETVYPNTVTWEHGTLSARHIIVAAGAIQTPRILARSGNQSNALGRHVSDHPAIAFPIDMLTDHYDTRHSGSRVSIVGRFRSSASSGSSSASGHAPDVQIMPIEGFVGETRLPMVMLALTDTRSRGTVDVFSEQPRINLNQLDDPTDRQRLRTAVRSLIRALSGPVLQGDPSLLDATDDDLDVWMIEHLGGYFHISGSARAGSPETSVANAHGRVHGVNNLWVGDISLCPTALSGNPMLVAMAIGDMVGNAVAAALSGA